MSLRHKSAIPLSSGMCAYDGANTPKRRWWNGPHISLIWPDEERSALSTVSTKMKDRHGYGRIASESSYDKHSALDPTSVLSFIKAIRSPAEMGYCTGGSTTMTRSG